MKYEAVMQEIRSKIEENKAILQKLLKNKDNQKVLDKWLKTELAYTSNAIEGNTLTRKETEMAIEERITSGAKPINDYLEAINHAKAFDLFKHLRPRRLKLMKTISCRYTKLFYRALMMLMPVFIGVSE